MNKISWSGGRNKVQVGLVEPNYDPKTNVVLGWINTGAQPNNSLLWDSKEITDISGTARWSVTPGSYKIIAVSENASGLYCAGNNSGNCNYDTSDFPFSISAPPADATVKVIVLDWDNKLVVNAPVLIVAKDFSRSFSGVTASDGSFIFRIPAGTYIVEVYVPPGREDLVRPIPVEFKIAAGETRQIGMQFGRLAKIINGTVTFTNKEPVPDAQVEAYNEASGQRMIAMTNTAGAYSMNVGSGKWLVGIRPVDPITARWRSPSQYQYVEFSQDPVTEVKTVNFTVPSADAKIIVRTVDENGRAIPDVGVVLDMKGAAEPKPASELMVPSDFRKTDSDGLAVFLTLPGKYYLRSFLPPESGFINPAEQSIQVIAHETKEVTLVFQEKGTAIVATINGVVKLDNGTPVDALVWAWSDSGRSLQTKTDSSGVFSLQVSFGERWHIGAGREVSGFPYKSSEIIVDANKTSITVEIVLVRSGVLPLPQSVTVSQTASQSVIVQLEDKAKVFIPAGAAAPSGSVTISVKPTAEAPSQPAAKVVSTVYEITVKDQLGQTIKQLKQEAEITLPYDKTNLKALGVNEDAVVPSYFDETTGAWVKVNDYTLDKTKNVVVSRVKHLTRFALVAAADILPPPASSSVTVKQTGSGKALLQWTNPTLDFYYAKIYRSTQANVLGSAIFAEVYGNSQLDTGLTEGTRYYYTVRAVDPAGNESTNTNQASIILSKFVEKPAVRFGTNLFFGMTNNPDVKALQELLTKLGIYDGPVTGNFFSLTKAAVMKFQDTYAAEILKPIGLTSPTGYVGTRTRAKLNQLVSQ